MQHARVTGFLNLTALLVGLVVYGCTGSKAINTPGGRKSAAAVPCPTKGPAKLTEESLNLDASSAVQSQSKSGGALQLFDVLGRGGYVTIGFYGVETGLDAFKAPFENGSKVTFSNANGVVDILNIPYCVKATNPSDQQLQRCLSRSAWNKISLSSADKSRVRSAWQPKQFFKNCTAQFTVDPGDGGIQNGRFRVRVWTAEHCFQPSYSTHVVLRAYVPPESASALAGWKGGYVPISLDETDGISFRNKLLAATRGGGELNDPDLVKKLFILRSLDGRSANSYQETLQSMCLDKYSSLPKLTDPATPGRSVEAKFVDCLTVTDVSTFKGTIFSANLSQKNSNQLPASYMDVSESVIRRHREIALDVIAKKSEQANVSSIDSNLKNLFSFAPEMKEYVSASQFAISIFDGILHSRRMEAMQFEQMGGGGASPGANLNADLFAGLADYITMLKLDYSTVGLNDLVTMLTSYLKIEGAANIVSKFVCSLVNKSSCVDFYVSPPDTARLEEIALGKKTANIWAYLGKRLNAFILKTNNLLAFDGKPHPLKILPEDSDYISNLKTSALWTKFSLEVMLMKKNPVADIPALAPFAQLVQSLVVNNCKAAGWGGALFPVLGNVGFPAGGQVFRALALTGLNEELTIVPINETASNFDTSQCQGMSVRESLGIGKAFLPGNNQLQILRPEKAAFAVRVDSSALDSGQSDAPYRYLTSRVVYKFQGSAGDAVQVTSPSDSGLAISFLGIPALVLSAHNGGLVNGVVFPELPEISTPDPDTGLPVDASGRTILNCAP